jgi:hypothetical protein
MSAKEGCLRNNYYVDFGLLGLSAIPSAYRKLLVQRSKRLAQHIPLLNVSFRFAELRE